MSYRKRTFILLEVLIAITLSMLFSFFFITRPFELYQKTLTALEKAEGERLADYAFSEIKEAFLQGNIPSAHLPMKEEKKGPFMLSSCVIQWPGSSSFSVERSYEIFCKAEKMGKEGRVYRLFYITVFLKTEKIDKKSYSYRLLLCQ